MANFWKALDYVLGNEGGYSDIKEDRGGATNYGITQQTLNRYIALHPKTEVPDCVKKLTIRNAEEIYRSAYWRFDGIKNDAIATKLFDMAVNFGPGTAVQMVQKIIGVAVDGKIGPQTNDAINSIDPLILLESLVISCRERYSSIIANDPTQIKFRDGWMKRARRIPLDKSNTKP